MNLMIRRVLVVLVMIVLVFLPVLLVIDYKKFGPVVLIVWIASIGYYLLMQRRLKMERQIQKENESDDEEDNEDSIDNESGDKTGK